MNNWIRDGKGPAFLLTPGGRIVFPDPGEVNKWIAQMVREPRKRTRGPGKKPYPARRPIK